MSSKCPRLYWISSKTWFPHPCHKLDPKKHWHRLSKKCWWALNQNKAALVEEPEEDATEQGLQGYGQVLSTLGWAEPHFCKWWSLNSRKTVVFLQSIPLIPGTQQWESGIQNLTGSYLCISDRSHRKRRHFSLIITYIWVLAFSPPC